MSINRRRNWVDNHIPDIRVLGQLTNFFLFSRGEILIDQFPNPFYVISLYNSTKDREPVLNIKCILKSIGEYPSDFNFITRSSCIDVITKEYDVFVSGDSAWGNGSWGFLDGDLLVVSVDGFLRVDWEGTFGLTDYTVTKVDFGVVVLVDGTFFLSTTITYKPDLLKLRKHLSPSCHHPTNLNHGIQIHLSQISQSILNWKSLNLHIYLMMNILIVRVPLLSDFKGHLIQIGNDNRWFISYPIGENSFCLWKVNIIDLQWLLIQITHLF